MTEDDMTIRALATAAALSVMALTGIASEAEAKTRVHIGIGVGTPGFGYGDCDYSLIFHDCYDPWPGYGFRHPSYFHRRDSFDEPYFHRHRRLSCNAVIRSLREKGYRSVRARDCEGNYYSFTGRMNGKRYVIRVNSISGYTSRDRM
jgi:hypothetical protein